MDGLPIGSTNFVLPPSGQIVDFLDSLLPGLANQKVQGVLRITTDLPAISVVGFRARYNERQQFLLSTVMPVNEEGLSYSPEHFFPYWIDEGGFGSDIILFSGRPGQSALGELIFVRSDGIPIDVDVK